MTDSAKNTILFSLFYRGEEYLIQTSRNEYHSLMTLLSDRLPVSGFGLCSGMGSCGTCLVTIDGMPTLACAVRVDDEIANTRIVVQENHF